MADALALMARCLALTLAVELAGAAAIFRIRDADALGLVALAQCTTNPLVEAGTICAFAFLPHPVAAVVALEVAAFAAEALIYRAKGVGANPWLASAVLNALSACVGFVVFSL